MDKPIERVLWSLAIPGFGQILNRKYIKGLVFILLEFVVNNKSRLNSGIMFSFLGDTEAAREVIDFQWLLFYPCMYMFAMWDAYKDAGGGQLPYSFLPFVLPAYCGTLGVIYGECVHVGHVLLGPIWLPMATSVVGAIIGVILRHQLQSRHSDM